MPAALAALNNVCSDPLLAVLLLFLSTPAEGVLCGAPGGAAGAGGAEGAAGDVCCGTFVGGCR